MNEPTRIPLWWEVGAGGYGHHESTHPAFDSICDKQVFIWSGEHGAYWGPNRAGYYDRDRAGIYSFREAYACTAHCGPEKKIAYEVASSGITRAQMSMQCSWVAKSAANWAGELLTLPEYINEEIPLDSVRRFCADIRRQLEIIEKWGQQ